jgi:transposase-like protein
MWQDANMNAYSLDLRKKIVEAKERGTPTAEVAKTFGVGLSTVKRYAATAREGKPLAPKRSAQAPNRSSTKRRGSSWKRTSKSALRRRSRTGASFWRVWREYG